MRGAGIIYQGNRFITHTSLEPNHSAIQTFSSWQKFVLILIFISILIGVGLNWLLSIQVILSVLITIYFSDRDPVGPYSVTVPARRTMYLRFNDLQHPEPIPRAKDYASVIESDVPIVVQHTRLDSRQDANALLSTIAYSQAA